MGLSQAGLAEVDLDNCIAWGEEQAMMWTTEASSHWD